MSNSVKNSSLGRQHRGVLRRPKPSMRRTLADKAESLHLEPSVTGLSLKRDNLKQRETTKSTRCSGSLDSNSSPEAASVARRSTSNRRTVVTDSRDTPMRITIKAPSANNRAEASQSSVSTSNSRPLPILERRWDLSAENISEYHCDLLFDGAVAAAAMERQQIRIARQLSLAEQQRQEELARGDITPRTMEDIELAIAMSLSQQDQHLHGAIQLTENLGDGTELDMTYEALIQLEDVSVGLTQYTIDSLPCHAIDSSTRCVSLNTGCPICMTDFKENDKDILRLPCNHLFHKECIVPWLRRSKKCCICKYELTDVQPFQPQ